MGGTGVSARGVKTLTAKLGGVLVEFVKERSARGEETIGSELGGDELVDLDHGRVPTVVVEAAVKPPLCTVGLVSRGLVVAAHAKSQHIKDAQILPVGDVEEAIPAVGGVDGDNALDVGLNLLLSLQVSQYSTIDSQEPQRALAAR